MCGFAEADFECSNASPGMARRWVAGCLRRWGLLELVDTAVLLTSELVSNAVMHAASAPWVEVSVGDGVLEVGVGDHEPRLPHPETDRRPGGTRDLAALAEGGRGLLLVEALADEWGATSLVGGKELWFRLGVSEWRGRPDCRCTDSGADRVSLRSGRHIHSQPGPD